MTTSSDPQAPLRDFPRTRDFFIGIDSDGCVFDSMEVKHKECFIPNIIQFYGLAAISKYAREVAEFVNLYSATRGVNRFPGIPLVFDLLAERPEIARRGFTIPRIDGLRDWLKRESKHSNPALKAEVAATGDPDLERALAWSLAVNQSISEATWRLSVGKAKAASAAKAGKPSSRVRSGEPVDQRDRQERPPLPFRPRVA